MGRKPRIHIPGGFYHVIARGNSRQRLFFAPGDQPFLARLLAEGVERYRHRIHAFCFMGNHIHLLIQVDREPVSLIAHNFCFRYSREINCRLGKSGHLFERRHRSIWVQSDQQLLGLLRYIHCNPLRAGLVNAPEDWTWSSHLAYIGRRGAHPLWLTTETCLGLLARNSKEARKRYVNLMRADEEESQDLLEEFTPLGSARLIWQEEQTARTRAHSTTPKPSVPLRTILNSVTQVTGVTPKAMKALGRDRVASRARALVAVVVQQNRTVALKTFAEETGRDPSTLSHAARRLVKLTRTDPAAKAQLCAVRKLLSGAGRDSD